MISKEKEHCLGKRCYDLFWDRCKNCDRCYSLTNAVDYFYVEDTVFPDKKTKVRLKAKMDIWDNKKVKIHFLQRIDNKD